jgi:ATP-dependent 26S proteasome regulatory subunit
LIFLTPPYPDGLIDRLSFPHPNEEARARIMQIDCRNITVSPDVNFDELARSCDEFNGAQCKAVCVEAGTHLDKVRSKSSMKTLWKEYKKNKVMKIYC